LKQIIKGFFLAIVLLFYGCDANRIIDENVDLDKGVWVIDQKPNFVFEVTDTNLKYNVYFNVRNAIDYKYHNLYFSYHLLSEEGKEIATELKEVFLFHPQTGKPLGSGLGDIFEHRVSLLENKQFDTPGQYKLIVEQYMRTDSLYGVLSVGARVEKDADKE